RPDGRAGGLTVRSGLTDADLHPAFRTRVPRRPTIPATALIAVPRAASTRPGGSSPYRRLRHTTGGPWSLPSRRVSAGGQMLNTGIASGAEPPSAGSVDSVAVADRSMQVLEYLVASIAAIAAVVLAFVH